jgi:hypothetical protein
MEKSVKRSIHAALLCLALAAVLAACGGVSNAPVGDTQLTQLTPVLTTGKVEAQPSPVPTDQAPPAQVPTQVPTVSSSSGAPLVTVAFQGGMCPAGECKGLRATLYRDGSYEGPDLQRKCCISSQEIADLAREIDGANYVDIRSKKFTGTCPTAFDGQEIIYTFHTPGGEQIIASCQVEIDHTAPPFRALEAVLSAAGL